MKRLSDEELNAVLDKEWEDTPPPDLDVARAIAEAQLKEDRKQEGETKAV